MVRRSTSATHNDSKWFTPLWRYGYRLTVVFFVVNIMQLRGEPSEIRFTVVIYSPTSTVTEYYCIGFTARNTTQTRNGKFTADSFMWLDSTPWGYSGWAWGQPVQAVGVSRKSPLKSFKIHFRRTVEPWATMSRAIPQSIILGTTSLAQRRFLHRFKHVPDYSNKVSSAKNLRSLSSRAETLF